MEELQSLKNPTRILTALMFIAFIIYTIGVDGLSQILPFASQTTLTIIVGVAAWAVTQYGTERRVVRAEELRDEINQETNEIQDALVDAFSSFDEGSYEDGV